MSAVRLRCVSITLVPQFMVDDGEHLTPLQVQPIIVPMADWGDVVQRFAEATAQLRAQVEGTIPFPAADAG